MSKAQHELPILVTGAAGRIGSVGRSVTELLLARGFRVRAQVRVDDERATRLRALGAEVVVGDLLDLTAVHRAIEGCERLCFAMSVSPSYLEAAANIAVVAKHHVWPRLRRVVGALPQLGNQVFDVQPRDRVPEPLAPGKEHVL